VPPPTKVALLALTIDERAIILGQLEDPPAGLAELRGVLLKRARVASARRARPDPGLDPFVS
jgi:hypothetical protein